MSNNILQIRSVSHQYSDGIRALGGVSFSLQPHTFTCLVGPSGSGKSTLMQIIAGLIRPTSGEILLRGQVLDSPQRNIGVAFQDANLMPWRTVLKNLVLPLEVMGIAKAERHQRAEYWLRLLGLEGFEEYYPSSLSGGMAQRLAIGRALITEPDILLLDEPFASLDALTREKLSEELLRIWAETRKTVLMVTHSLPEAVLLADDVLVMSNRPGSIVQRIHIPLPRPRSLKLLTDPDFVAAHAQIRDAMQL